MSSFLSLCCAPQVSSISGSDTDESSSESDLSDDESAGPQGSAGRRAARGQKGAAAVVQGAQVVFRTQGKYTYLTHNVRVARSLHTTWLMRYLLCKPVPPAALQFLHDRHPAKVCHKRA